MESIIQVQGLEYDYGGIAALSGLDLTIERGVRLALLGPNGSGKTTLLFHLNGTLRPRGGVIRLWGQPADYTRRGLQGWRQRVGLLFQNPDDQLFAATVEQDVSFGPMNLGLPAGEVRARVAEALCASGIEPLADRATHMLSFGQKKRVALAGVLAMRPEVLLLDEPMAGLDPRGTDDMLPILEQLRGRGSTLVLATHDMDLAFSWADALAILHHGRVCRLGPPDQLLQDSDLLTQCRLRMPCVLEIALFLQRHGSLSAGGTIPRTPAELRDALRSAQGATGETNAVCARFPREGA